MQEHLLPSAGRQETGNADTHQILPTQEGKKNFSHEKELLGLVLFVSQARHFHYFLNEFDFYWILKIWAKNNLSFPLLSISISKRDFVEKCIE